MSSKSSAYGEIITRSNWIKYKRMAMLVLPIFRGKFMISDLKNPRRIKFGTSTSNFQTRMRRIASLC